jgi:DNA modification methylase
MNSPCGDAQTTDANGLGDVTASVMHGDAVRLLALMPDQSVHAIVTDPPYAVHKDGSMLGQVSTNYHRSETPLPWLRRQRPQRLQLLVPHLAR